MGVQVISVSLPNQTKGARLLPKNNSCTNFNIHFPVDIMAHNPAKGQLEHH